MKKTIGIRREDKNIWERRVPVIPEHVERLAKKYGIKSLIQPFERRAISREDYLKAGADFNEDLSDCKVILAVKEIPINLIMPEKIYLFFSHTIKGQDYNMPLLRKIMNTKSTLIDYECIKDSAGRRLVFFGRYAGLSGMIDALHGYGKRLSSLGYDTPFLEVKSTYEYHDLEEAKAEIKRVGEKIAEEGLPAEFAPYTFGFTGYGNVSRGAQEIFDLLPYENLTPEELLSLNKNDNRILCKTVFKEEDMVKLKVGADKFDLNDYFNNPEKYEEQFSKYIPSLNVIINAIYWDEKYPRIIEKEFLKKRDRGKFELVCDISCDIDGSVEFTYKVTDSDKPAYVYNPADGSFTDGYEGEGIVNIAVDNLPAELPRDASAEFSTALTPFLPGIIEADLSKSFSECEFPEEIKKAVIVYKGELTPDYKYLEEYLK